MPQHALIGKLYVEIYGSCEGEGCQELFMCSKEACMPMDEWALFAATEASTQGWLVSSSNALLCKRCSEHAEPLDERPLMERARNEIVAIAHALISQKISFLDGARRLTALQFDVSSHSNDPDFSVFVQIDSQTHHHPNSSAQVLCAESWTSKCEDEIQKLQISYAQELSISCTKLIERFSSKGVSS